ncbi:translocating chain-associated membrane protein 1 [Onthophagus taurus]|uniref:translocating chain-associated membrane protein 1 n=1 Tax=Onthophagus taurus TaxID=166361 RepID=UPI000C2046E5|nr:translocating chain-associated membrane protein 1 [Onthophagus taurus]
MVKPVRKNSSKNPPIFSHEFIIQNHADIVSCVAMVIVIGLMVQVTAPIASLFIALQHNVTEAGEVPLYGPGYKDWAAVFFYSLICIVIHAIIQEYVLDKVSKRLHLSKSKLAIFTNSGQLAVFYLCSTIWGFDIVLRERFIPEISLIWNNYPSPMTFMMKLYFIVQLAYCLHELPELYFQKVKKEEYTSRITRSLAGVVLITIPYFLNFNRLLICLLVLHYASELVLHIGQLIQTVDRDDKFTKVTGIVSKIVLNLARLGSIIIAVLTLWFGLAQGEQQELNIQTGYFNTPLIRLAILGGILALQMYLTFNYINQELQLIAKNSESSGGAVASKGKKKDKSKKTKKSDESDLPEVDQNTNKNLRKQKVK